MSSDLNTINGLDDFVNGQVYYLITQDDGGFIEPYTEWVRVICQISKNARKETVIRLVDEMWDYWDEWLIDKECWKFIMPESEFLQYLANTSHAHNDNGDHHKASIEGAVDYVTVGFDNDYSRSAVDIPAFRQYTSEQYRILKPGETYYEFYIYPAKRESFKVPPVGTIIFTIEANSLEEARNARNAWLSNGRYTSNQIERSIRIVIISAENEKELSQRDKYEEIIHMFWESSVSEAEFRARLANWVSLTTI